MKTVFFTTLFTIVGIFASLAQAQIIPLTIDSTQSTLNISIQGSQRASVLSGDATLDIQLTGPPAGNAQLTSLNLVADEGLNFNFLLVSASTMPGDVSLSLVTPGPAGAISGTTFSQLNNILELGGNLSVSDPFNLAGGSQTVDLSTIALSPADFNSIIVTQSGDNITISGSLSDSQMTSFGLLELDGTFVATGIVPVSVLKGDVDMDGDVDFNDIPAFIAVLQAGTFQAEADCDCSTAVDFGDIPAFIAILQMQ